eukprot:2664832-Rhodomonas_salina.1
MAKPVHPLFWRMDDPYIPPSKRGYTQPDPFESSTKWHDALFIVGPNLILPDEWEMLEAEGDNVEIASELSKVIKEDAQQEGWCPGPGYNDIPIMPSSVPSPKGELKGKDILRAWQNQMWSSSPARVYKVLAVLIKDGTIVQQRQESCLRMSQGPRMTQGHCTFELTEPSPYLWGEGYELGDEEALRFATKLTALIEERGVIWVPAQRYRDVTVPPYLVQPRAAKEDVWSTYLRTELEYEAGHFGLIITWVLSGGKVTQVVSPRTGGIYLLSAAEHDRRQRAGVTNALYAPLPWVVRVENRRAQLEHDRNAAISVPSSGPVDQEGGGGGVNADEEEDRDEAPLYIPESVHEEMLGGRAGTQEVLEENDGDSVHDSEGTPGGPGTMQTDEGDVASSHQAIPPSIPQRDRQRAGASGCDVKS